MVVETFHNNPKAFCDTAFPFLMKAEAENNLLIGISSGFAAATLQAGAGEKFFWVVRDGAAISGAAMWTPPHDLVLSHPFADSSLAVLAQSLLEARLPLPGLLGPDYAAREFAGMWTAAMGLTADLWRRERVYRLDRVEILPLSPGRLVLAEPNHRAVLLPLMKDSPDTVALLDGFISEGRLYLWWDEGPVSRAAWTGPTPHGVRITGVYTPPELRRRGYATAAVSTLSSLLLRQGKSFCVLYTDLSNPISNSIYQRIGYKPILDCYHYRFIS